MVSTISSTRLQQSMMHGIAIRSGELQKISQSISDGRTVKKYTDLDAMEAYKSTYYQEVQDNSANMEKICKSVSDKIRVMDKTLQHLASILNSANIAASHSIINPNKHPYIQAISQTLVTVAAQLNVEYNGQYLFSGSKIDVKPVLDISRNTNLMLDLNKHELVPTANYYRGDGYINSIEIFPGEVVQYGITAADETFQKMIAGLHYMRDGLSDNNKEAINKGKQLLQTSISEIQEKIMQLGFADQLVEERKSLYFQAGSDAVGRIKELVDVDLIASSFELRQLEEKLSTLYKSIGIIMEQPRQLMQQLN